MVPAAVSINTESKNHGLSVFEKFAVKGIAVKIQSTKPFTGYIIN